MHRVIKQWCRPSFVQRRALVTASAAVRIDTEQTRYTCLSQEVAPFALAQEMPPMLVGLTGCAAHGKDTVADHLVKNHGFVKLSFAGPLKDGVAAIFGFDRSRLEDDREYKENPSSWGESPRHYLQWLGTDILRKHVTPDFFMIRMQNELTTQMALGSNVVISDARFDNEAQMILDGGKDAGYDSEVWKVDAATRLIVGRALDAHASETGISPELVTYVLDNNKEGKERLLAQVDALMDKN